VKVSWPRADKQCSGVGCRPAYRRPYAGQAFAAERHGVIQPAAAAVAAGSFAAWDKVSCLPLKGCSEGQAGDLCLFEISGIGPKQTVSLMIRRVQRQ
jgi:hypothetical protein